MPGFIPPALAAAWELCSRDLPLRTVHEVAIGVSAIEMAGTPNMPQACEAWMGNQVVSSRQRLEGRGARLVHRELVKVNGYQGIDLVWQGERQPSGASTTYTRLVAAGNRIYELTEAALVNRPRSGLAIPAA